MRKLTAAAALAAASVLAIGVPASAQDDTASVVVVHGIPDTPVDVYVNGDLTLDDFAPGTVTPALDLPAGTYEIDITAPDAPDASSPILEASATVEAGGNYTIVAHLDASGAPTVTPFVNDTTATKAGEGGLAVRHTAAAPAVDVYAGDAKVIESLENPDNAGPLYVPVGTVSASVTAAGATDPVIGPADVPVTEGVLTIVYAIGSLEDDTLGVAVQTIDVGVEAEEPTDPPATDDEEEAAPVPSRVDTGDSGLAAQSSGPNAAVLATLAFLVTMTGAAGATSLVRSRRQG